MARSFSVGSRGSSIAVRSSAINSPAGIARLHRPTHLETSKNLQFIFFSKFSLKKIKKLFTSCCCPCFFERIFSNTKLQNSNFYDEVLVIHRLFTVRYLVNNPVHKN